MTIEIADRISFGNKKLVALNLTDMQNSGSKYKVGDTAWAVKANNNTDSSDTFKESVGAKSSEDTRNEVTFTPATDDDDGVAWVIYN